MRPVVDAEELKWRQRCDARTLAEAEQIKADKERYSGAITGAKEIAKEELERVKGIAKVANMKTPNTNVGKTEVSTSGISVPNPSVPNTTVPFNKRGYRNPATIGRF